MLDVVENHSLLMLSKIEKIHLQLFFWVEFIPQAPNDIVGPEKVLISQVL